jgi:hypothetical protein
MSALEKRGQATECLGLGRPCGGRSRPTYVIPIWLRECRIAPEPAINKSDKWKVAKRLITTARDRLSKSSRFSAALGAWEFKDVLITQPASRAE